jgi:glycerol-3-phosphate dehydrogenase
VVNAAGPWTASLLHRRRRTGGGHLRLIKGSHIVVKRIFEHDNAYIFQHPDGRIVFAIPYERDFTLIGTTDLDYRGTPTRSPSAKTKSAICARWPAQYFTQPITADVVWTYSGVRPLVEDGADAKAVTRDYRLEVDDDGPPILSVFGGKITFRKLAEEAVDQIAKSLDNRHAAGPTTPACRAATCSAPNRITARCWNSASGRRQVARHSGLPLRWCVTAAPTAPASTPCWPTAPTSRRSATKSPRPVRSGSGIPAPLRMGPYRPGHPLAPHQAGPAPAGQRRRPTSNLAHCPSFGPIVPSR